MEAAIAYVESLRVEVTRLARSIDDPDPADLAAFDTAVAAWKSAKAAVEASLGGDS